MSNYISRGSEWRRWDLHVHTMGTMKNDQFVSQDFDSFCLTMFKRAIENNVEAIGITDYFNIENYKKVKEFVRNIDEQHDCTKEEKIKIENIFILPNVELRMLPVTDKGSLINIHCLFNPAYTLKLENDFFVSLEHAGYKMNRQGLIDLGRSMARDDNIDDSTAYKRGIENFVITPDHLQELLNNNHRLRENILVAVSNSSNDGVSGFQEHYTFFENESGSLDSVRKELYKMSDAIFSSSNRDREYFLGKKDGNNENTVIEKCGSLKPCIHGSDAHTEKQLFNPSKNRYCWIKSDLTFEGLKQILYEPEDRVIIQEIKPDDKESYRIIDSVQFDNEQFMTDKIYINKNLTAIIGGKSTGKTLLLGSISQTIDPEEVESRLKEVYSQRSKAIKNFEVTWKDDQQNRSDMPEAENDENEQNSANKKIIYIPQSYLNRLVEEEGESIHKIIEDVLKQEKGNIYADLANFEREQNRNIADGIASLFNYIENITEQAEELRNIGDKKGIEIEIKKIESEIDGLKEAAGMTDEEIENYNNLVQKIRDVNVKIEKLQLDKSELDELKKLYLFGDIDLPELSQPLFNNVNTFYEKLKKETQDQWQKFIDDELTNLSNQIKSNESNLRKIESKFNPLLEKAKKSYALKEKIKQIDIQQVKLKDIQKKWKLIQKTQEAARETVKNLIKLSDNFYVCYEQYKEEILKQTIISDGLKFSLTTQHKTKSFQENFINEIFDNRKKLSSDLSNYEYKDNKDFSEKLYSLLRDILNNKLALKNRYTNQQAITELLQNWYKYDYQITQDGDDISQMSPGKRSLVLLKLLIELDNSKCPILLDQPEDDLDNRSVYNDLV